MYNRCIQVAAANLGMNVVCKYVEGSSACTYCRNHCERSKCEKVSKLHITQLHCIFKISDIK